MPSTPRRLPIAISAVLGLTLLSSVVHGYLDGRWRPAEDLAAAGLRLSELPEHCGDWTLVEESQLDDGAAKMLRCYGSAVRTYQNENTRETIRVALLYGPRGPIAVHIPEICFTSTGTEQIGKRKSAQIKTAGAEHEFWSTEFSRAPNPEPAINVWYAWTDGDGPFQAVESPRFWMTDHLYKIQVAGPVASDTGHPCRDFLQEFLPHVERVIE